MTVGQKHDVFISYAHEQATHDTIEVMKSKFEKEEVSYWQDKDNLRVGQKWAPAIDEAIDNCSAVVTIITPAATASQYVVYEWCFALGRRKPVLPILFEGNNSDVHVKLQEYNYLDFRDGKRDWNKLIEDIKGIKTETLVQTKEENPELLQAVENMVRSRPKRPIKPTDIITLLMRQRILTQSQADKISQLIIQQIANTRSSDS